MSFLSESLITRAMRKTKYILEAIVESKKAVVYYAVDLSEKSLRDSLAPLASAFPSIKFVGLLGTYDDALLWAQANIQSNVSKMYLWLGSSIGNLTREEAAQFLRKVQESAMNHNDRFLCGIDHRNDPKKVAIAYNDHQGITRDFILNGLDHINTIFAQPVLDRSKFEYVSIYNAQKGRHEAYYKSKYAQSLFNGIHTSPILINENELINVEYSYKYSEEEVTTLLIEANLSLVTNWTDKEGLYDLYLCQKQ